jgi:hypothetical protein
MCIRFLLWAFCLVLIVMNTSIVGSSANSYLWHPSYADDREILHYGRYRNVPLSFKVNLNTASYDDLMSLPNATSAIALSVIEARPYKSLQDLDKLQAKVPQNQIILLRRKWASYVCFQDCQVSYVPKYPE